MTDYPRAASYVRVSGQSQAGDAHVSLPVQREKFAQHCAAKRYVPGGEYCDVESGRRDSRKEYQRMLTAARGKLLDVIVVQRLDRFGRNPREILKRIWELEALGVRVEATDEDLQSEIAMMLHAYLAGEESKRISARVIPTMERVARSGRWVGREPYGYILNRDPTSPERGHLTIDDGEAQVVRRVFDLYLSGRFGFSSIAALLNAEDVPSSTGGIWWGGAVMDLLSVPTYVGRPTWRGIVYPGGCPAIVADDVWQAARSIHRARKVAWHRQPANSAFILAGLVVCACGRRRVCHVPDRRYPIRYYVCTVRIASGTCALKSIRADRLESDVVDQVRKWQIILPETSPIDDSLERRAQLAGQRTRLRAKIERIKRRRDAAYDELMDQTITKEDYLAGNKRYLVELAELEAELSELRETVTPVHDPLQAIATLERFRAAVDKATPAELHALLVDLIERVDVESMTSWRVVPVPSLAGVVSEAP